MSNATANEEFFAEERARLVGRILSAVQAMDDVSLCKVDIVNKIAEVALNFEKETYGNEESER